MAHDRTDLKVELLGSEVELTGKKMPNGETRRRVRMSDVTINVTQSKRGGWQEAHFHKGLHETYTVIVGMMVVAFDETLEGASENPPVGSVSVEVEMLELGDSVTVGAGEAHNIYLYPGTTITTVVYGEPVGNPGKKGNDWWDAKPGFNEGTKGLSRKDIRRMAG
jgi:mannose-6-phosphate isomerase-like protein (cupin superfamily)